MEDKKLTGYPSIDKPWLKYYSEEAINAPLPHMTAYEYLKHMNQERLDCQAIESGAGNYTYKELFATIDKTSAALYRLGIKKGEIVLAMLPALPHESLLLYAVDAANAALAQLPPQNTAETVCNFANKYNAKLFFTSGSLLTQNMEAEVYSHTKIKHIITIVPAKNGFSDKRTISWDDLLQLGNECDVPKINRCPQDLLFLASTGGSTGEPKSVMLNDDCINIAVHQMLCSALPYDSGDRWLRLWPLFSGAAAVANSHLPLCAGMNVLIRPLPTNITEFDRVILKEKPQHLMLIPQLLDLLEHSTRIKNVDLSYVKSVGCGGLGITIQFEKRANEFFAKHHMNCFLGFGWGCTESSAVAAHRHNRQTTVVGTAGIPQVKTIVSAFDPETEKELKYGIEGELCIQSPTIMMGYYNEPQMTAKVVRTHTDGTIWLHTGDLGAVSEDGFITVKGRMTRMIFVSPSAKIYPQALETSVSTVSGVQEVAFCKIPNQEHDGFFRPVCFVVPDKEHTADEVKKAVIDYCNTSFPEYSRPCAVYVCEALPLTRVGKIDYRSLEQMAVESTK